MTFAYHLRNVNNYQTYICKWHEQQMKLIHFLGKSELVKHAVLTFGHEHEIQVGV